MAAPANRVALNSVLGIGAMTTSLLIALPAPAAAQNSGRPAVTRPSTTATTAQAPPPTGSGTREWSGELGSSGHPLMTADAIRAGAANFRACLDRLAPEAARRGVPRASFDRVTAGLTPDLRIMDLMDAQPEFTKAIWEYLDLLVSDERVSRGREILARYPEAFAAVEKAYGVDRYTLAALWGVELNYGTAIGERSVLRSTATLACIGRRQDYFRDEFLAALELLHRGDVKADRLVGSWAGAFGPTQFMPTSFKRYAVDFDQDGRRDVVDSVPDMLASTANNLKKDGWLPGQTWGYEVALPSGFDYRFADPAHVMTTGEWASLGVTRVSGKPFPRPNDRAYLLIPAGAGGPTFLILNNFRPLIQYNGSEPYALAVGHLADRLRGDGPIVQAWPRHERVLTSAERYELQQHLVRRGFDIGGQPNGRLSAKSRAAIKRYQSSVGLVPDGFATADLLDHLRSR